MKTITFSDTDIKVLGIFLDNCNPCRSGCAYPEMQGKYPEDCSECQFTKDVRELKKKIESEVDDGRYRISN